MDFLHEMRYRNPFNHIILILDNFFAHRTENMAITAEIRDKTKKMADLFGLKLFPRSWELRLRIFASH